MAFFGSTERSWSVDFDKELAAFERGDFDTAPRESILLAAEQADGGAECNWGVVYRRGDGAQQDYKRGVNWKGL